MGEFICTTMCPQSEIAARKHQKRIHLLERDPETNVVDDRRCVKEYVRSAAGIDKCDNRGTMRSIDALRNTVDYLLGELIISFHSKKSLIQITDFITDRLRAVRQDFIIQRYPAYQCIPILEKIIKYHILLRWLHRKTEKFDQKLNHQFLTSYFSDLLTFYDHESKIEKDFLHNFVNYPEFISLYLLMNFDDSLTYINVLKLSLKFDKRMKKNETFYNAICMCQHYHVQNYSRFLKNIRNLSVFQKIILIDGITLVRIKYMNLIVRAYSSKHFTVSLNSLFDWLKFAHMEDLHEVLHIYNIPVVNQSVQFEKSHEATISSAVVDKLVKAHGLEEIGSRDIMNQWWELIS